MKAAVVGVLTLAGLVLTGHATAASIKRTLPESARIVPDGRQMIVTVPQDEIAAEVRGDAVHISNPIGSKQAQEALVPIRAALSDYKFDQKAMVISDELALNADWLGIKSTELNKDASKARLSQALDASSSQQLLAITYTYTFTPNFDYLMVSSDVSMLNKTGPAKGKKEDRALPSNADFYRVFQCMVRLPDVKKDFKGNAGKWAANDGALIKQSLDKSLAKLAVIMKQGLEMTPEQEQGWQYGKSSKVLERDAEGVLVLNIVGQIAYMYGGPDFPPPL